MVETTVSYDNPPPLRTLIIIPAYNEEESLGRVIRGVQRAVPQADIVVINDGSTDATAEVAAGCGATVITQPYNLGIGSTMQTGFLYARTNGYDMAVQVDGDGQHDPTEIPLLVQHAQQVDVAIGSRYIEDRGYITPWLRRVGIVILANLLTVLVGQKVTDPTSGFRASGRRAIDFFAYDYPFDYPEPEAIIKMQRAGLRFTEIPVMMNPRYGGQSSITPVRSAYYMIKVIMSVLINLLRQRPRIAGEVRHAPTD